MLVLKYHDINGNNYGLAVDYSKRIFSENLRISTLIGGKKATRKEIKTLKNELLDSGFIKSNEWL